MNLWQTYVCAASIDEALQALEDGPGPAYLIAGGTDLLLDLDQGRHPSAHTLVDINSIEALKRIEQRRDHLFVGAAAPVSRVTEDPLVLHHAPALAEACGLIGGPQVRNVATLGGNVAHALPAADGTIALMALDAVAELACRTGTRRVPLRDLFMGPGKSALKPSEELIVGFELPLGTESSASCFRRIMRPQGVALPILNVAVWLQRSGQFIADASIVVGPGGPVPWRAVAAEQILRGQPPSTETIETGLEAVLSQVGFRSSPRRASAEYRRHLVGDLFRDTVMCAWKRTLEKVDQHG